MSTYNICFREEIRKFDYQFFRLKKKSALSGVMTSALLGTSSVELAV